MRLVSSTERSAACSAAITSSTEILLVAPSSLFPSAKSDEGSFEFGRASSELLSLLS